MLVGYGFKSRIVDGHKSMNTVQRSSEYLVHFRCADERCAQWWTIGDFDTPPGRWNQDVIFCPKCGRVQKLNDENLIQC